MINRLRKIYPDYLILIKIFDKFFDAQTNDPVSPERLKKSYIIINENSYEVHKKISSLN